MSYNERNLDPLEPAGMSGEERQAPATPGEGFSDMAAGIPDPGATGAAASGTQEPLPPVEPAAGTSGGDAWSPGGVGQPSTPPVRPATAPYRAGAGAYGGDSTPDDRLMAALSWLCAAVLQVPLVSLVLLLGEGNKDRPFQRYHAVASIAFWLAAIVYEVLAAIVYVILGILTLGIGLVCLWPIFLVPHLVALYYAYAAYTGRRPTIPLITDMMRGQGWA